MEKLPGFSDKISKRCLSFIKYIRKCHPDDKTWMLLLFMINNFLFITQFWLNIRLINRSMETNSGNLRNDSEITDIEININS